MAQCEDKDPVDIGEYRVSEGGSPPNLGDIQEYFSREQSQSIKRPPHYYRLMTGLKVLTMAEPLDRIKMIGLRRLVVPEPLDGIKLKLNFPMSSRFAFGGAWTYSNTKPTKYELGCVLNSTAGGDH